MSSLYGDFDRLIKSQLVPIIYWPAGHAVPYEVGEIMKRDAETVIGQARRDIAAGEEIVVAFDIVSEVETGADVGPVLADEPE